MKIKSKFLREKSEPPQKACRSFRRFLGKFQKFQKIIHKEECFDKISASPQKVLMVDAIPPVKRCKRAGNLERWFKL